MHYLHQVLNPSVAMTYCGREGMRLKELLEMYLANGKKGNHPDGNCMFVILCPASRSCGTFGCVPDHFFGRHSQRFWARFTRTNSRSSRLREDPSRTRKRLPRKEFVKGNILRSRSPKKISSISGKVFLLLTVWICWTWLCLLQANCIKSGIFLCRVGKFFTRKFSFLWKSGNFYMHFWGILSRLLIFPYLI